MKIFQKILSIILISSSLICFAKEQQEESSKIEVSNLDVPVTYTCPCCWLYRCTVKRYIQLYPESGLVMQESAVILPEQIMLAIDLLAQDIEFIDVQGNLIVPELSVKGNMVLPMSSKNIDYKAYKEIIDHVDRQTTLTAQELYLLWKDQLEMLKVITVVDILKDK